MPARARVRQRVAVGCFATPDMPAAQTHSRRGGDSTLVTRRARNVEFGIFDMSAIRTLKKLHEENNQKTALLVKQVMDELGIYPDE